MKPFLDRRDFLRSGLVAAASLATMPLAVSRASATEGGRALIGFQVPPVAMRLLSSVLAGVQTRYRPDLGTQAVVIAGASGELAVDVVSKAPPDGATALILPSSLSTLIPNLHKSPRDFADRLVPVAGIGEMPLAVLVGPAVPAEIVTLQGFLQWVRVHPAANRYGVPGLWTSPHFIGNELARLSELPLRVSGYKGTLALIKDVAAGSIAAAISLIPGAGDDPLALGVRVLAIASPTRWSALPDVPTLRESGFDIEAPVESLGFYLPAGTPAEKVRELALAVRAAVRDSEVLANMKANGMAPMPSPETDYAAWIARERAAWSALVSLRNFTA